MLKLCEYEEIGGIVVVLMILIFEYEGMMCNWDYRYCWLCDSFFMVKVLNGLGVIKIMEDYFVYVLNFVISVFEGYMQLLFGLGYEYVLIEEICFGFGGYCGNLLVWCGNVVYM